MFYGVDGSRMGRSERQMARKIERLTDRTVKTKKAKEYYAAGDQIASRLV
jgi:hypothetical protein